ncbi:hypothetical protein [Brachybacterium sp.]|uniref:hypothetical protein n=1 Tax=Brachybacterium sp. TaxID=1891286 RepID=UPI002ED66104
MIGYLGTPGALVELSYRGGLSTGTDRPARFSRTMGGKRKAMLGPVGRREWDVSFSLIGSRDTHGLVAVAQSNDSLMWYPADAVAGNMLSPQASGWGSTPANATDAGLVQLPDGTVARSVVAESVVRVGSAHGAYEMVPVRAGELVTVGAWSIGGQHFRGFWRDAAGTSITNWADEATAHLGWGWHQATLTPPPGAAYVELHLAGGMQYARPVVSWGESAVDRPGRGCPASVVHGLSEALTVISQDDAYGSISVTITEVG